MLLNAQDKKASEVKVLLVIYNSTPSISHPLPHLYLYDSYYFCNNLWSIKKLRFVSKKPFHVARLHRKQTVDAIVYSKISTSVRQSGYLT